LIFGPIGTIFQVSQKHQLEKKGDKMKHYAYLIFLLFLTNSCATIVSGTTQEVSFNSEPQDVEVTVGGKVIGKTPLTIQLDKKSGQAVEFNLEGYKRQTRALTTTTDSWFWGNIVIGGLFGSTTDGVSGSIHEYSPSQYYVTMVADSSDSVNSIKSDKAKIKEFIVMGYQQIVTDIARGGGEYLNSLVLMLKVADSKRTESVKKIKALSEVYTIIPDFAEQVANYFIK